MALLQTSRLVVLLLGLAVVAGCSSIPYVGQLTEPGPDKIALSIDQYCKRVSSGGRSAFRSRVNADAAPHAIYIWCHGENPPWLPDDRWADWLQAPEGVTWFNQSLDEVTK